MQSLSTGRIPTSSFDAALHLPQVLPPLQLAPLSAKAPLPPLNKPSLQPLQAPASSQASGSAPAGTNTAQQLGSSAVTHGRLDLSVACASSCSLNANYTDWSQCRRLCTAMVQCASGTSNSQLVIDLGDKSHCV